MTVTFSARRSDQPLQIGSRHGYRIDGDQAFINADISVPPYHPGGAWALELWASERPYQGGELAGVLVSEVQFDLATPLAPHTHRIEVTVPARLPQQGRAYFMSLALVERDERHVRDVASYPSLESFPAPQLEGDVGYEIRGHEVLLNAAAVSNPRAEGNLSGTLALELWGWPVGVPEALERGQGVCLGAAQLQPVAGGESLSALVCRGAFSEPPPGNYQLSLLLREWTHAVGYLTRDRRDFAQSYYVAAPAAEALEAEALEAVTLEGSFDVVALEAEAFDAVLDAAVTSEDGASEDGASQAEASEAEVPAAILTSVLPKAPQEAASWDDGLPEAASWDAVAEAVAERIAAEPVAVSEEVAAESAVAEEAVVEPVALEQAVVELAVSEEVASEAVLADEAVVEPVVLEEALSEPVVAEEAVALKAEPPVAVQVVLPAVEAAPPASVTRASRGVSINTATVDELSRVKGLNGKVAKEIIKHRPYASLEGLVEVRGIGRKMLDKIRTLITL
ncbi:MAG: hypothetical protein RL685_4574 [Pseudomonadota bacterium]|jgi:competence ComEA-like helix-hairpin-helix protein